MATDLYVSVQYKRDTTAGWAAANPVLKAGEVGLEVADIQVVGGVEILIYKTDTNGDPMPLFKYGDGTSVWAALPYVIGTEGPPGQKGPAPEFRVESGNVVYSYDNFATSTVLYSLTSVTGPQGKQGVEGPVGPPGPSMAISDSTTSTSSSTAASSNAVHVAYQAATNAQASATAALTAATTANTTADSAISGLSGKADKATQIIVSPPLTGGGTLSADINLGLNTSGLVAVTRKVSTTAPLRGGGDLTTDLTLSVDKATASALGVVVPDGVVVTVDSGGMLKFNSATSVTAGVVPAGGATNTFYGRRSAEYGFFPLSSIPGVPVGGIIMWSGQTTDVPTGWALCDGGNGTPDLRNKFIVGAGDKYTPKTSGGSEKTGSTILTVAQLPAHAHGYTAVTVDVGGGKNVLSGGDVRVAGVSSTTGSAGGGLGHEHDLTPLYYALCYIMKL